MGCVGSLCHIVAHQSFGSVGLAAPRLKVPGPACTVEQLEAFLSAQLFANVFFMFSTSCCHRTPFPMLGPSNFFAFSPKSALWLPCHTEPVSNTLGWKRDPAELCAAWRPAEPQLGPRGKLPGSTGARSHVWELGSSAGKPGKRASAAPLPSPAISTVGFPWPVSWEEKPGEAAMREANLGHHREQRVPASHQYMLN